MPAVPDWELFQEAPTEAATGFGAALLPGRGGSLVPETRAQGPWAVCAFPQNKLLPKVGFLLPLRNLHLNEPLMEHTPNCLASQAPSFNTYY